MYHFRVKIIRRAKAGKGVAAAMAYRSGGRSLAAVSAYRTGGKLKDPNNGRCYDFRRKAHIDADGFGILHAEIMLPQGAPLWMSDRQALVNAIEAAEKRKDAQLVREIEVSLPRELTLDQQVELMRSFVAIMFVAQGMIADVAIHDERASDGGRNPHAHVLLTLRRAATDGFGLKERAWNNPSLVREWREAWAIMANEALAAAGHEPRLDHRAHRDREVPFEPDLYVGPKRTHPFEGVIASVREAQRAAIKARNLYRTLEQPTLVLDAITREKATFTARDVDRAIRRITGLTPDEPLFEEVWKAINDSRNLVEVMSDERGQRRFTTREMLDVEIALARSARSLSLRGVDRSGVAAPRALSEEQVAVFKHVMQGPDLTLVTGVAGAGKTTVLKSVAEALAEQGYTVRGAALAALAAKTLGDEAGISAQTLASLLHDWERRGPEGMSAARRPLTSQDALILDEAGMVDSRTMGRVLTAAEAAGARVILVGDAQQLQAIGAGAAFRALGDTHGAARLETVRRQQADWMRDATQALAKGDVPTALEAYRGKRAVHASPSTDAAMDDLIAAWLRDRASTTSQLILTHRTSDVDALNLRARAALRARGELGEDVRVCVQKQERDESGVIVQRAAHRTFASGDRILFLQNDRTLAVQNGARGSVESLTTEGEFRVLLDDGRRVAFNAADYGHITQGYASTVHKAQGQTVDRAYVLATRTFDAHTTYVALSRHRIGADLFYGQDQFSKPAALAALLGRPRPKDSTLDYLRRPARDEGRDSEGDGSRQPLGRLIAGAPAGSLDTLTPVLKPTNAFIAAHTSRAPQTAIDLIRANAARQRQRRQERERDRSLEE